MDASTGAGLATLLAGAGAWSIWSSTRPPVGGRRRLGARVAARRPGGRRSGGAVAEWMLRAGIGVTPAQFVAVSLLAALGGAVGAWLLFDGAAPAVLGGVLAALLPVSGHRRRRAAAVEAAAGAWPRVLEEIRLRTGSLGRSIPQALFEAGRRGPAEWRPAFVAAEREWLLTTDFSRTVDLLKERLADPTADVVAETLLMAHEIGGADLDGALADLIEDRMVDLEGRRDAASRQAGVRFARRFVLLVPLGMAVAGLSIGTGRQAYATTGGQIAVVVGLAAVAACWLWSGRLMRIPSAPRVFR